MPQTLEWTEAEAHPEPDCPPIGLEPERKAKVCTAIMGAPTEFQDMTLGKAA